MSELDAKDAAALAAERRILWTDPGATEAENRRLYANLMASPELAATRAISGVEGGKGLGKELDVTALMGQLIEQAAAVNRGSLAQAEAMLMNQATALQSIFSRLVEHGMGCVNVEPFEANMRIALRAQSQCWAALETLAAIKNPSSVAFVRQANIGNAVQVNNGTPAPSRPRESEITPSKPLEATHGGRLDTGTESTAGSANQQLETVGAVNRAANS